MHDKNVWCILPSLQWFMHCLGEKGGEGGGRARGETGRRGERGRGEREGEKSL